MFTGEGFSLNLGFRKFSSSQEMDSVLFHVSQKLCVHQLKNPPILLIIKLYRRVFVFTGVDSVENRIIIAKERRRSG